MATPIGTNVVTSLARRHIVPDITDNIYAANLVFFRLNSAGKRKIQGGTQIEQPLMYSRMAAGGFYSGFDLLDISPSDTIKNAAFDWKQAYVPVTVDGLTLIKTDQPMAIADFIKQYFAQAEMEMAAVLGAALWNDGSVTKSIDGIKGAVDDGSVLGTYGGLLRTGSTNTWWRSTVDTAAGPLSMTKLQTMFGSVTKGGRHPTLIVSTQANYNFYYILNTALQAFPAQPQGHDEQLASAGFTNLLFNGVPWTVDPNCPTNHIFMLNEDFMSFVVSPRADFFLEDFQTPVNQDAMTAKLLWAGNLMFSNLALQGKFTAIAS